jgi:drug/metabolite transporter (DMT)-like permease
MVSRAASLPEASPRNRLLGIGLMCGALLCFAGLDTSAKWLNQSLHPMQVVWARYLCSVIIVMAFINPSTTPGVLVTKRPWLQLIRSLLLLLSTALNFFALQYLQLAETISIMFATPLLVALLAGPWLGEHIGPRRLAAVVVGFIGVLVVLRPGLGGLHPAAFLSLIGCICYAIFNLLTRQLAGVDSSETTMFYSGLGGTVIMCVLVPFFWIAPMEWQQGALMALMGTFAAIGHWMLIKAHRLAPASILAPFIYSQLAWMILLGWLVFDQWPDRWTFIGGSIVIASGLYLLYRERVRGVGSAAM